MFFLCERHAIQNTEVFTDKHISAVPTSVVLSPWVEHALSENVENNF